VVFIISSAKAGAVKARAKRAAARVVLIIEFLLKDSELMFRKQLCRTAIPSANKLGTQIRELYVRCR